MVKSSFSAPLEARVISSQQQLNSDYILTLECDSLPELSHRLCALNIDGCCYPVLWSPAANRWLVYQSQQIAQSCSQQYQSCDRVKILSCYQHALPDFDERNILVLTHSAALPWALALLAQLKQDGRSLSCLIDADKALPVNIVPSRIITGRLPAWVTGTLTLLEDWQVMARIAQDDMPGCYDGRFAEMLRDWSIDVANEQVVALGLSSWVAALQLQPGHVIEVDDILSV